jgi:hypothetical protein
MRNATTKPASLEQRLAERIARKRGDVFMRADFDDLGGYDQVGRALRGRARPSLIDGAPTPVKGIREVAREALGRIGVETDLTPLERAYNAGISTQVTTGRVVGVLGRVRRKINFNGVPLRYERVGPSPR